ncbi:MAG: ribosome silencing factor [Gemmatimonadetes bacterium]|nr:ribosome silencing factor [Gemmatimonadota bacterium]
MSRVRGGTIHDGSEEHVAQAREKHEPEHLERPEEVTVAVDAALERNARQSVLLDLRGVSDATDWFLIASGDSDTHARAIADNLIDRLREAGYRPAGVEGKGAGNWILLDYITLVIHIFLPRVRDYYDLERLWGDAPALAIE